MSAQFGPRSRWVQSLIVGIIPVLFALHGCGSDEDERLAKARETLRRQQAVQTAPPNAQASRIEASPSLAGGNAVSPAASQAAPGATLPEYPGARKVSTGTGLDPALDDGLTMEMLETRDSVDTVIAFYTQHMVPANDRLKPSRTEDRLDGRRVVRLSLPEPDGGLQTVEAREEPGKTSIQLLNMKGKRSREVPASIPGVDPLAPSSPRRSTKLSP